MVADDDKSFEHKVEVEVERRVEIRNLRKDVQQNTAKVNELCGLITKNGLITEVAVTKSSLKKLWYYVCLLATAVFFKLWDKL